MADLRGETRGRSRHLRGRDKSRSRHLQGRDKGNGRSRVCGLDTDVSARGNTPYKFEVQERKWEGEGTSGVGRGIRCEKGHPIRLEAQCLGVIKHQIQRPLPFNIINFEEYWQGFRLVGTKDHEAARRASIEAANRAVVDSSDSGPPKVGHPVMKPTVNDVLFDGEGSNSGVFSLVGKRVIPHNRPLAKKGRGSSYTNWFTLELFGPILTTLKANRFKLCETIKQLNRRFLPTHTPVGTIQGVYSGLSESTLRSWFESDGRSFKPRPHAAINYLCPEKPAS